MVNENKLQLFMVKVLRYVVNIIGSLVYWYKL